MNHQVFSILKPIKSIMLGLAKKENLKKKQKKILLCMLKLSLLINLAKMKLFNQMQKDILMMYVQNFEKIFMKVEYIQKKFIVLYKNIL